MKTTRLHFYLLHLFIAVITLSCNEDDPAEPDQVLLTSNSFSGVFISRGPGMDNSITYIVPDVSPYKQTTKHLFSSITIKDLSDKCFITAFGSVESPKVDLPNGQYLRMLYHEISAEKKWVVLQPGILDGTLALRAFQRDAALDKELLAEERHWFIIHDISDDDNYKWVIIESLKHRGHYIMDAGTYANANAIRLMEQADKRDATRWEIHKP